MHSAPIQAVLSAVRQKYGQDCVRYHGSDQLETQGACFTIWTVPATISVTTQDGTLKDGLYDVQIEGVPPGDYIYCSTLQLSELLGVIDKLRQPQHMWPMSAV